MQKSALADHPVHDLMRRRWSPRAFSPEMVTEAQVLSMLEAARWAASCFNDQPWSFLVGFKEDETWQGIRDSLVEANRSWASAAPVLMLAMAHEDFVASGKPNRHAQYDVGQAVAGLVLQATALRLFAHQMAGFDADAARSRFGIPERQTPMTAIALGHIGDPASLPEPLAEREVAERDRVTLATFTFAGTWGTPAAFVK